MKNRIMILLCALICTSAIAQKLEMNASGKYEITGIVSIDSLTKAQLFDITYDWLTNVKYSSAGVKWIDISHGPMIVKQYFKPLPPNVGYASMKIRFVLTIDFKDGKFKYTYTNFYYYTLSEGNKIFFEPEFKDNDKDERLKIIDEVEKYVQTSIDELIAYIKKNQVKSNW